MGGGIHTISLAPNGNVEDSHLPTLSIIIPCFNESHTITYILERVKMLLLPIIKKLSLLMIVALMAQ